MQDAERWNEAEEVYQFGNNAGLPRKPVLENETELDIKPMVSSDWTSRMIVAAEAGNPSNKTAAHWGGRLIHELLSELIIEADLPRLMTRKIAKGLITAEDAAQLVKMLVQLMQDPRMKEAFSTRAEILNEAEMLTASGQLLRPDRVAILPPEKVILIDYKTGEAEPLHKLQIKSYQNLIQELEAKKSGGLFGLSE